MEGITRRNFVVSVLLLNQGVYWTPYLSWQGRKYRENFGGDLVRD
jgi:hypothetical protein